MKDELGNRMKENFEKRTRQYLPRRTYTIIRLDGKCFGKFTKGLDKPFDKDFAFIMNETAKFLCENVQGAKLAYVQSDEISLLLTDFETTTTDAWFDGQIQKIVSISAAFATYKFNNLVSEFAKENDIKWMSTINIPKYGLFDARVFSIPDPTEVENYFIWRQKDAIRNSLQMLAQSNFSHKELNKKSQAMMHDMLFEKGLNWNDEDKGFKQGRIITKKKTIDIEQFPLTNSVSFSRSSYWKTEYAFDFVKERENFIDIIPKY